jgi:hypothetical protein
MTIKMDEKIVGVWFLGGDEQDWMGGLRDEGDHYSFTYRFRYYAPDCANKTTPFDGADRKSWYAAKINKSVPHEKLIGVPRLLLEELVKQGFGDKQRGEVLNEGDFDDFLTRFSQQPWAHMKKVTAEEAKKMNSPDSQG